MGSVHSEAAPKTANADKVRPNTLEKSKTKTPENEVTNPHPDNLSDTIAMPHDVDQDPEDTGEKNSRTPTKTGELRKKTKVTNNGPTSSTRHKHQSTCPATCIPGSTPSHKISNYPDTRAGHHDQKRDLVSTKRKKAKKELTKPKTLPPVMAHKEQKAERKEQTGPSDLQSNPKRGTNQETRRFPSPRQNQFPADGTVKWTQPYPSAPSGLTKLTPTDRGKESAEELLLVKRQLKLSIKSKTVTLSESRASSLSSKKSNHKTMEQFDVSSKLRYPQNATGLARCDWRRSKSETFIHLHSAEWRQGLYEAAFNHKSKSAIERRNIDFIVEVKEEMAIRNVFKVPSNKFQSTMKSTSLKKLRYLNKPQTPSKTQSQLLQLKERSTTAGSVHAMAHKQLLKPETPDCLRDINRLDPEVTSKTKVLPDSSMSASMGHKGHTREVKTPHLFPDHFKTKNQKKQEICLVTDAMPCTKSQENAQNMPASECPKLGGQQEALKVNSTDLQPKALIYRVLNPVLDGGLFTKIQQKSSSSFDSDTCSLESMSLPLYNVEDSESEEQGIAGTWSIRYPILKPAVFIYPEPEVKTEAIVPAAVCPPAVAPPVSQCLTNQVIEVIIKPTAELPNPIAQMSVVNPGANSQALNITDSRATAHPLGNEQRAMQVRTDFPDHARVQPPESALPPTQEVNRNLEKGDSEETLVKQDEGQSPKETASELAEKWQPFIYYTCTVRQRCPKPLPANVTYWRFPARGPLLEPKWIMTLNLTSSLVKVTRLCLDQQENDGQLVMEAAGEGNCIGNKTNG